MPTFSSNTLFQTTAQYYSSYVNVIFVCLEEKEKNEVVCFWT